MPLANWHDWAALGMILYSTGLTAPIISMYTSVRTTQLPLPLLVLIASLTVIPLKECEKPGWELKARLPTEQC